MAFTIHRQYGRVAKSAVLMANMNDTVKVKKLFLSLYGVFGKETLQHLFCLAVLASSFQFQSYHSVKTKKQIKTFTE